MPNPTCEEAAAHLFLSTNRVRQLQREGVIPRTTSKDWSIENIRRRYIEHLRNVKITSQNPPKAAQRPAGLEPDAGNIVDLNEERAKLAREQRVGHELRNATSRGELLPAGEVVEGWQAAIARARSLLLGLPAAAAEELALLAAAGAGPVREKLADLMSAALSELANTAVEDVEDAA